MRRFLFSLIVLAAAARSFDSHSMVVSKTGIAKLQTFNLTSPPRTWNSNAEFQPTAPYYATFFYPWYPHWSSEGHAPPRNWFSNYLPDPKPDVFEDRKSVV